MSAQGARRRRVSDGIALAEVIVAVAVITTAVLSALGAIRISADAASEHRDRAEALGGLSSAASAIQAGAIGHISCTNQPTYIQQTYEARLDHALHAAGAVPVDIVEPVAYWNGTSFGPECAEDREYTLQRITLEAVGRHGVAQRLNVVISSRHSS